jgi:deoxycytidylate deaminase
MAPCPDCARGIIQSGIKKIYLPKECFDGSNPRQVAWLETWPISKTMLEECGVEIIIEDNYS